MFDEGQRKYFEKLVLSKQKVKIVVRNGYYYAGQIMAVSTNSILFLDKFNKEIYFSFEDIARVEAIQDNGREETDKERQADKSRGKKQTQKGITTPPKSCFSG